MSTSGSVTKVTGGKWVKTRLCGCGECQSLKRECPKKDAKDAIWLWGSEYAPGEDIPLIDSSGEVIDSWD